MSVGMRVTNGNLQLHVAEDGDPSKPPILLLHGITSSGETWDWLVPALADRFRVLRLDFRGHGQSDRAPGEYTAAGYVSDAVAALEQAAGQPCVVIGHSLGGAIAAALTQQRPDLLTGAVMEDPPLWPTPAADAQADPSGLEGNALLDGFQLMRESIPQLQAAQTPHDALVGLLVAAPDTTGASTFGESLYPDSIAAMATAMLAVDAAVLDPVLTGEMRAFVERSAPFEVPSLIVTADPAKPDAVASAELAGGFASISKDIEVLTVDGAGHLIHDEQASRDTFRTAVLAFLDRIAPA